MNGETGGSVGTAVLSPTTTLIWEAPAAGKEPEGTGTAMIPVSL